jgi:hypothetical protein
MSQQHAGLELHEEASSRLVQSPGKRHATLSTQTIECGSAAMLLVEAWEGGPVHPHSHVQC